MMASLRSRLLAALLALTAIGLVLGGAITYAEQRSFLYQRVDQQLRAAVPVSAHQLLEGDTRPGFDHGGPGPGDGHGGAPDFGPPAGTYAQLRDASGRVLAKGIFHYSGPTSGPGPVLPRHIPLDQPISVPGAKGAGTSYRLLATADPGSGSRLLVAVPLLQTNQTLHRLLGVEALVFAAVLAALAAVAWVVVRVGLLPLDRMGHTAGAIAGGDLSRRVADTDARTEVGRLGIALNAMLDRLEAAFAERQASEDKLRRFLADASHELRTPLASIRGYAELFRMGAIADPDEEARALRRIEDEAARMGVLVEDLLTLARLDEVADAPHLDVDAGALVRDAADDARAIAPDRAIEVDAAPGLLVLGDPYQLRQVLGNLLRNALTHTPPGTPVEVLADRAEGGVRLEVRDHGPGLPPGADPDELFQRFWRAEGGRTRGRGGAGLGLAIAAAIADAHGGRVEAANAPGGGARFTIWLPAAESARHKAVGHR